MMDKKKHRRNPSKRKHESKSEPRRPSAETSKGESSVDAALAASSGSTNFLGSGLLVDQQGRLIVYDTDKDRPSHRHASDYEIVSFGTGGTATATAVVDDSVTLNSDTSNGVNDAESCWLNTKYEFVVRKLQLDYGAGVKLLHSPQGVIQCIYFTTPAMQQAYNAVPQFLCIDTSLSFTSDVTPQGGLVKQNVCLFLAEDGNGRSIIVSVGISTLGDNTRWLTETFKSCNPAWRQVRCVLADPVPSVVEQAIRRCFMGCHVCCNTWQAARWMSKFSLPAASVEEIHSYIDSLLKNRDQDQSKIQTYVGANAYSKLVQVLDKNNLTNFIHSGLEKVLKKFKPLESLSLLQPEDFLTFFFDVIRKMEEDRKTYALNRFQETVTSKQSPADTLTQYAYYLIHQQTLLAQEKIDQQNSEAKLFNTYGTSTQECSCLFGRVFRLPCRHILMLTSELKVKSHIPFELRWTVYHCLFGYEIEQRSASPTNDDSNSQSESQAVKQEFVLSPREGQVIFCAPSPGTYTSSVNDVQFIKAEPTSQPA